MYKGDRFYKNGVPVKRKSTSMALYVYKRMNTYTYTYKLYNQI